MSPANLLFLLLIIPLLVSETYCARPQDNYGDGLSPPNPPVCANCSICQYPDCGHPQLPPAPPAYQYPAYGAPPPPAMAPPPIGYPSNVPPPSPQGNCPPGPPGQGQGQGQCCNQYTSPPPPSFYTYVNESASAASILPLPLVLAPSSSNFGSAVVFVLLVLASVLHL